MAGALLLALAGRRVAEVDLRVQVVAAVLRHTQTPVGQCHVVQVGAKALVGPGAHRVATRLVQVRLRTRILRGGTWKREIRYR